VALAVVAAASTVGAVWAAEEEQVLQPAVDVAVGRPVMPEQVETDAAGPGQQYRQHPHHARCK